MTQHDLLIVGAGPVGMALALALRDSGLDTVLADTRPREATAADPRVLALAHGTRLTLERLGVWHALPATAIDTIHVSQRGGFGRTLIRAADHGLPALGHVASAGALAGALRSALDAADIPVLDETEVGALETGDDGITAQLAGQHAGPRRARLVVRAEGSVGAEESELLIRDYHQHALIALVEAEGAARGTAFERFTPAGPVALLPYGTAYALVHVAAPQQADELLALDDADYLARLQEHLGGRLRLTSVSERLRYPLGLRARRKPVGPRTVWLGNAAQTLHPVAGQGFNLALRDVWTLADTLLRHPGDPGAPATLDAYARRRAPDRFGTIRFTDTLVHLFSNDQPALRHLRGAGLFALDLVGPLRHFVAKRMMFGARAWP
ncbi:2-octaprenyl-6-methoxyphenyl hydroxylase [Pseudothauera nasutitermitis]|uniref:2-octaprenyl-6-methoxyphenyl hydroxylase n=1 Tax=Pseudothauera nasutitermitis TaxID=2565930 RepID=A0A4S4B2G1_9RHOO|nr:FAD-dependent monooxygenase [Pseudothauera nasutitermitis]THF65877.1 2-octaprenyl-6-methoxyphenyl hydroxylase [Pseudothauera nasutitermitis]